MDSPSNWIRLIRDSRNNSIFLQKSPSNDIGYIPFSGSDVVIRLTKQGTEYQGEYSTDGGLNYTVVGSTDGFESLTDIGLTIASTQSGNVFTAEFDYFRIYAPRGGRVPGLTDISIVILVLLLIGTFIYIRKKSVLPPNN